MSLKNINTRNQFHGLVVAVHSGPVVSEVEVETAAGIISAVVTTSSVERLGLRPGNEAIALFKATEVLLARVD